MSARLWLNDASDGSRCDVTSLVYKSLKLHFTLLMSFLRSQPVEFKFMFNCFVYFHQYIIQSHARVDSSDRELVQPKKINKFEEWAFDFAHSFYSFRLFDWVSLPEHSNSTRSTRKEETLINTRKKASTWSLLGVEWTCFAHNFTEWELFFAIAQIETMNIQWSFCARFHLKAGPTISFWWFVFFLSGDNFTIVNKNKKNGNHVLLLWKIKEHVFDSIADHLLKGMFVSNRGDLQIERDKLFDQNWLRIIAAGLSSGCIRSGLKITTLLSCATVRDNDNVIV